MNVTGFCKDGLINASQSWNTSDPNLSQCMRDTVLDAFPCLILVVSSPLFLLSKANRSSTTSQFPPNTRRLSLLFWTKILCNLILFVNMACELGMRVSTVEDYLYPSDLFHPICLMTFFVIATTLTVIEKMAHLHTSPPLFFFWGTLFICSVPTFKVQVEQLNGPGFAWGQVMLTVSFLPVILIQFLLNCWSDLDDVDSENRGTLEQSASFLSCLFFAWMDPLLWHGFKRTLVFDDLPKPPIFISVNYNVQEFLSKWQKRVQKLGISFHAKQEPGHTKKHMSLWVVLVKTYGWTMLGISFVAFIHYSLTFVSPIMLKLLIKVVEDKDYAWKGIFFSFTLLASTMGWTLTFHWYCQKLTNCSIKVRSSLLSMIFRKSLRLSNKARKSYTVGEITNYMSVDAQRIVDSFFFLNQIWSAPYMIIVSMYFLYQELGVSSFAGIVVLLILIPVNVWGSKKAEALQEDQLKNKDLRLKLLNETMIGMKVLKLYGWENPFMEKISKIRDGEIRVLRSSAKLWALTNFTFACTPFLVTVIVFSVYIAISPDNILTADKIFVAMSLFNIMRFPLTFLPWALIDTIKMLVSVKRIAKFLNAEELDPASISDQVSDLSNAIEIKDATFSWSDSEESEMAEESSSENFAFKITDVDMAIRRGSLVAVVGNVGSGKSSLLQAILGDMEKSHGTVARNGSVAYVPQQAWIQNLNVADNISFNKSLNPTRYEKILEACALAADLESLPSRDQTEIGENGINLSGGQKQRISLARAVASDSDIYLLDDPLSAVDAHVGEHIFQNIISSKSGMLKHKTRLFVTNGVKNLKDVDFIYVMKNGTIAEKGTYEELLSDGNAFSDFLSHYDSDKKVDKKKVLKSSKPPSSHHFKRKRSTSESIGINSSGGRAVERSLSETHYGSPRIGSLQLDEAVSAVKSLISPMPASSYRPLPEIAERDKELEDLPTETIPPTQDLGRLIEDEEAMVGKVKLSVYLNYLKIIGYPVCSVLFLMYVVGEVFHSFSNIWLAVWADANAGTNSTNATNNDTFMFLGVYASLGCAEIVSEITRELCLFLYCAKASKIIHENLLRGVFQSPMSFFDTNPTGRIINRFSADIDILDGTLPYTITDFLWSLCEVVAVIMVICYSTPVFIGVAIPLAVVYFIVQRFYITSSRQLKRLEAIKKSPIFSHFSESLQGASVIRAFKQEDRFITESEQKVEDNVKCYYLCLSANRWLGARIETIGNLIVFFSSLFAILSRYSISGGLAGLSITFALNITDTLNWMIRMICDLETNSVSVERIVEYAQNTPEAPWEVEDQDKNLPPNWPYLGKVKFDHYETRYREGLDLVLKDLSLETKAGEKVGICGRTGAGKSSLTLSLFRIIEASDGKITIDGVDISKLGLHKLRQNISIIPQDPVLFTGNLRFNLDPINKHSDEEIWQALEHSHLKEFVSTLSNGIEHEVTEKGENFSVGQKQLLCLARALLRKTKILILDEATASVDLETDDLIQETIKEEFFDCTILTIAHRLNTIMESDRIAVFSKGCLVEFDNPKTLLQNPNSEFAKMASNPGLL